MSEEIEFLTVMQVGTELGVSASTVGKLIKQFPQWVESTKQGRSVLYTYDVLKRLKLIRKLQEQKKSPQQIETALSKKFDPIALETNSESKSDTKPVTKKSRTKTSAGLVKQVDQLKTTVMKLDAKVAVLSKELASIKKIKSGPSKIEKFEAELKRLSKILEG